MNESDLKKFLKKLIVEGKIEDVCNMLIAIYQSDTSKQDEIYLLYQQYKENKKSTLLGFNSDNSDKNRIIAALLKQVDGYNSTSSSKKVKSWVPLNPILFILLGFLIGVTVNNVVFGKDNTYKYKVYDSVSGNIVKNAVLTILDEGGDFSINCDTLGNCLQNGRKELFFKAAGYNSSDTLTSQLNDSMSRRVELTPILTLVVSEEDLINYIADTARIFRVNESNLVIGELTKTEFKSYLDLPLPFLQKREIVSKKHNDIGLISELKILTIYPQDLKIEKEYGR